MAPQLVTVSPGSALDEARLQQLATAWPSGLSAAQLCEREACLRSSGWAHSCLTVYALVEEADPDVPLVSCEAYRTDAAARTGAPGVTHGFAYGIASVFTHEAHRGRGLASQLLQSVREALVSRGDCLFLYLMNQVTSSLYRRAGYAAAPCRAGTVHDWELRAEPGAAAPEGVRWLTDADVPGVASALCEQLNVLLRAAPRGMCAVLPSSEQLQWHVARDDTRRRLLGQPCGPSTRGAACGTSFALWALDVGQHSGNDSTLVLRVLVLSVGDEPEAVLSAAAHAAAAAGAECALVWDTDGLHESCTFGGEHQVPPWAPDAAALARMGISLRHVPRACGSVPFLAPVADGVSAQGWIFVPRAVWV